MSLVYRAFHRGMSGVLPGDRTLRAVLVGMLRETGLL
jgi:hypothetical protein